MFQSGRWDSNPRSRAPEARGLAAALHPDLFQSERQDLNLRSPGPRPGAITRLRYVLFVSSPCGSRTQPARLERPMTSPEVERAVLCAYSERQVGREALESSSAVLQTAARPSQLPAHVVVRARKDPMPCDTGLRLIPCRIDQVSQAQRHRGQRIRRLRMFGPQQVDVRPYAFRFANEA